MESDLCYSQSFTYLYVPLHFFSVDAVRNSCSKSSPWDYYLTFFSNELPLLTSSIMNKNCIKFHFIFYKKKICRYPINKKLYLRRFEIKDVTAKHFLISTDYLKLALQSREP